MADTVLSAPNADPAQLEGELRARPTLPQKLQVYGVVGGARVVYPDPGLTASQLTTAQQVIAAHIKKTDADILTLQQKALIAYIKLASPTLAQTIIATKVLARMMLRLTYREGVVDGVDTTV